HPGPAFSIVEIMAFLYFHQLRLDAKNPKWEERDRIVLSKGHASPTLYAAMYEKGFFDENVMLSLRKMGSLLQGHPSSKMPGVDATTGSLGLGLSQAVGMAIGAKILKSNIKVFAIIGDGECDEGQIWEAALFASHHELDNLFVFLDNNKDQYEGQVCDVLNLEPLDQKWMSFGWDVEAIDGHDFEAIDNFVTSSGKRKGKPHIAIADTQKGNGVSFMEGNSEYHARALNEDEFNRAIKELEEMQ
ncbi:MAG: transketolase, partial [Alphaproteobacteria bacterium]